MNETEKFPPIAIQIKKKKKKRRRSTTIWRKERLRQDSQMNIFHDFLSIYWFYQFNQSTKTYLRINYTTTLAIKLRAHIGAAVSHETSP